MCVCSPEIRTPWCGRDGCVRLTTTPPPTALVHVAQRPVALEAVQVQVMRAHVITSDWKTTLPPWVVDAIGTRIIGIHWERTKVDVAHGAGEVMAAADDWIVLMPDGTLMVYTPENYATLLQEVCR